MGSLYNQPAADRCRAAKLDVESGRSLVDVMQAVEDRPGDHLAVGLAAALHRSL
jgi:hypothetical protein